MPVRAHAPTHRSHRKLPLPPGPDWVDPVVKIIDDAARAKLTRTHRSGRRTGRGHTRHRGPGGSRGGSSGGSGASHRGQFQDGAGQWIGDAKRYHAGRRARHGRTQMPPYYTTPYGAVTIGSDWNPYASSHVDPATGMLVPGPGDQPPSVYGGIPGSPAPYVSTINVPGLHRGGSGGPVLPPIAGLRPGHDNVGYANPADNALALPGRHRHRLPATHRGHATRGTTSHHRHAPHPHAPHPHRSSHPHSPRQG